MIGVSRVEIFFYGGMIIMALAVLAIIVFGLIYALRKGSLDRTLTEEYGDLRKYNLQTERKKS